jgi:hypothetical protein
MSGLKINSQSLPQRCEICHKSDCFDPAKNYCERCVGVTEWIFLITGRSQSHKQIYFISGLRRVVMEVIICFITWLAWPISLIGIRRARDMGEIKHDRPLNSQLESIEEK